MNETLRIYKGTKIGYKTPQCFHIEIIRKKSNIIKIECAIYKDSNNSFIKVFFEAEFLSVFISYLIHTNLVK